MLVPMTPVQIMAPREQLRSVVATLHRLGTVQLTSTAGHGPGAAPAGPDDTSRTAELRTDVADLAAVLGLAETAAKAVAGQDRPRPATVAVPPERLDRLAPGLRPLLDRIGSLQAEYETVRRYRDALAVLLPLEPELSLLDERDLTRLGLATVVLVLDTPRAGILDTLRGALRTAVGDRFHLVGAPAGEQTVGCVLVAPHASMAELATLLAREHVRHVPLPSGYEQQSLAHAVTELSARLEALPGDLARAWGCLADRTAELAPAWRQQRSAAAGELDRLEAVALAGRTSHTASLTGWLPQRDIDALRVALAEVGPGIIVAELDPAVAGPAPVLLDNPPPVRPYQWLVSFFGLPRSGSLADDATATWCRLNGAAMVTAWR